MSDIEDLERRARGGAITTAELEMVRVHLCPADPSSRQMARKRAIAIAGAYLEHASDVGLIFELIRIAEDSDEPDAAVKDAAVRALARATGYRGQPVRMDL